MCLSWSTVLEYNFNQSRRFLDLLRKELNIFDKLAHAQIKLQCLLDCLFTEFIQVSRLQGDSCPYKMPKKKQVNAFAMYMQSIMPDLRREGRVFPNGMADVVPIAHPRWKVCDANTDTASRDRSVTVSP